MENRQLNNVETSLFESGFAKLRVKTTSLYTKRNFQTFVESPSWYYNTNKKSFSANSSTFLVFEYWDRQNWQNNKSMFLSHKHMPAIKDIFYTIKQDLLSDEFWTTEENRLVLLEGYQPKSIQMSKDNKWISFTLDLVEDQHKNLQKGVKISFSEVQGSASVLNVSEFMTLWQMIEDINLLQVQMAHFQIKVALDTEMRQEFVRLQQMPQGQNNYNNNYNQAPRQNNYNNGGYQGQGQQQQYRQPAPQQNYTPRPAPAPQPQQAPPQQNYTPRPAPAPQPQTPQQNFSAPKPNNLPPRVEENNTNSVPKSGLAGAMSSMTISPSEAIDSFMDDQD